MLSALSSHLIHDVGRLKSSPLRFPNYIGIAPAVRPEHVDIDRHLCGTFQQLKLKKQGRDAAGLETSEGRLQSVRLEKLDGTEKP